MRLHVGFVVVVSIASAGCNLLIDADKFRTEPVDAMPVPPDAEPDPMAVRGNILELTFNDGFARDSSTEMSVVNAVDGAVGTTEGKYGGGFEFTGVAGSRDRIDVENDAHLSIGNELTIEMWIKRRTSSADSLQWLYGDRGGGAYQQQYWLTIADAGGHVGFWTNDCVDSITHTTSILAIEPNVWLHLAVTWDGQTLHFYRDGQLIEEVQGFDHMACDVANPFLIGSAGGSASFHGTLDEIKVSSHAKTEDQVRASMEFNSQAAGL